MKPEPRACPHCGQPILAGAAYCVYCGKELPAEARPAVSSVRRHIAVPDREGLEGSCVLLYAGSDSMDVRRIGRIVADAVGLPLPDVTRQMRTSKGFVATGMDAGAAAELAEQIERKLRSRVLVIPEEACVPLPRVMRMRNAAFSAEGIACEAYTWDRTERFSVTWDETFAVSCGRLEVKEVQEKPDETPARKSVFSSSIQALVTKTHYEFLMDVIVFDPSAAEDGAPDSARAEARSGGWRRLRLDHNTAGFSLTEMDGDPTQAVGLLYRSSVNLERYARGVPMNHGVSLLASGAADSAWESLTFLSKRDFDSYTYWLMQLVRYGCPIPV